MRLHVLPAVGAIKLQQLGPIHLNGLYRDLRNKSSVLHAGTNRRHNPKIYERIARLRTQQVSYKKIAEALAQEFPDEPALTKDAVARIVARSREQNAVSRDLSVRTVATSTPSSAGP